MSRRLGYGIVVLGFAVLLALPTAGALPVSNRAADAPTLALVTDAIALPVGAVGHPLPSSTQVSLVLTLPYQHTGPLDALLAALQDPGSAEYRHFLTAGEFAADFDPPSAEVAQVRNVLGAAGGTQVHAGPSGATVSALVPAGAVDRLFDVQLEAFGSYRGIPLYTALGTPTLPASLSGLVSGIGGLSDATDGQLQLATPLMAPQPVAGLRGSSQYIANGSNQWLIGSDFTQAYGATQLFPGGSVGASARYPTDIAVATLLASSYNATTNANLPPWDPNVIDTYLNNSSAPQWPHSSLTGVPVSVDGITPPLPGSLGAANDTTGFEFENSLDLEMAGSLAPGAPLYNFYFAGSIAAGATTGDVGQLADAFAADLAAALNYPYPDGVRLGVISASFGLPDLNDSAWNSALVQAAAMGVTVVAASGDQGNAPSADTGRGPDGQWPVWPATAAFNTSGTMSIGGVTLTLAGGPAGEWNGSSLNVTYDHNITGISSMVTWYFNEGPANSGNWAGSEGGLSTVTAEPPWQFHSAAQPPIAAAAGVQGASFLGRAGPDLAFPANETVAYVLADAEGNLYFDVLGGTSIAAPVFAGLLADVAAVANTTYGYLDPVLYRVGSFFQAFPGPADPFFDVTVGANFVFSAGPGWDATTGWGGLAAGPFLEALGNSTVTGYVYTGPTPGLPSTSSGGGFPLSVLLLIVGLAVAAAVALVIAFGRPRRAPPPPPPGWGAPQAVAPGWTNAPYPAPPPGATGGTPSPPSGATFLCPYCGAPRPAEPVRCPRCGAL